MRIGGPKFNVFLWANMNVSCTEEKQQHSRRSWIKITKLHHSLAAHPTDTLRDELMPSQVSAYTHWTRFWCMWEN